MYDNEILDPSNSLNNPLDGSDPDQAAEIPPDPEEMLSLLTSDHLSERMIAARAFCELRDERAIALLARDWNGYVRKGVVWALGNCGDRRAIEPLVHALKTDISAVRLWAASSLAQIAKVNYEDIITVLPPLIEGLRRDLIAAVRSNCAWSIGQLCRELPFNVIYATAIDALIEALVEDEDLGVKEDARGALLKVGDPRGLQLIEELELEGII